MGFLVETCYVDVVWGSWMQVLWIADAEDSIVFYLLIADACLDILFLANAD